MNVLIPSYEPTMKMIILILELKKLGIEHIVIVNDGSDPSYGPLYERAEELGCSVLKHAVNLGKGKALKTGFKYIKKNGLGKIVVCADSDGQHSPENIVSIGKAAGANPDHLILGCRELIDGVPPKSKFGNKMAGYLFKIVSGIKISDTQTGLRAFPTQFLDWLLTIPGDRFDYEMNMLLELAKKIFYRSKCKLRQFIMMVTVLRISEHFPILLTSSQKYLNMVSGGQDKVSCKKKTVLPESFWVEPRTDFLRRHQFCLFYIV